MQGEAPPAYKGDLRADEQQPSRKHRAVQWDDERIGFLAMGEALRYLDPETDRGRQYDQRDVQRQEPSIQG